jgi:hypothetical protein
MLQRAALQTALKSKLEFEMKAKCEIDGDDPAWEEQCLLAAAAHERFDVTSVTQHIVESCMAIARQYGYKLEGSFPDTATGVCRFIPTNYGSMRTELPVDFVFSGDPNLVGL